MEIREGQDSSQSRSKVPLVQQAEEAGFGGLADGPEGAGKGRDVPTEESLRSLIFRGEPFGLRH
jgi:hypothetical protein